MRVLSISVFAVFIGTVFLGAVVGCGGGQPTQVADPEPYDDGMQSDPVGDPVDNPEEMPDDTGPAPVPSGPVEVTVSVRIGNEDGSAQIRLLDSNGDSVHEGASGTPFTVQSGTYSLEASITDARVMVDTPTKTEEVTLSPGEPQTVEVRFPVARVRLGVSRRGRMSYRGQITLFREGTEEEVASFRLSNNHIAITPGRYEANVRSGSLDTRVSGLMFMDGATQNVPIEVQ